jgi:hypothetical protein
VAWAALIPSFVSHATPDRHLNWDYDTDRENVSLVKPLGSAFVIVNRTPRTGPRRMRAVIGGFRWQP